MVAASLVSLASCGGPRMISLEPQGNEMWRGKTHAAIIEAYGAPTREASDGKDGKIIIYERTTTSVTTTADAGPGYYGGLYGFYYHTAMSPIVRTETETTTDYANFYIDGKGICYRVETNLERPETKSEREMREAAARKAKEAR